MPNQPTLPQPTDITAARCPRCHKLLEPDIGQHSDRGDLIYQLVCLNDGYSEFSAPTVAAARRTSSTVRSASERLLSLRLSGVVVPLKIDDAPKEA